MALSQTQIIQSLGEALAWFEKELGWGVAPQELSHLTGRIGELYAAMITRGQMALETNQQGYDVVSAEGERISVKTITTTTNIPFRESTFQFVDRVMILRLNVSDEDGVSVEELLDCSAEEFRGRHEARAGVRVYRIARIGPSGRAGGRSGFENLAVVRSAQIGHYSLREYENGSIEVLVEDKPQPVAKPHLRDIASSIGVNVMHESGLQKNTRQLGSEIIRVLMAR